MLLKEKYVTRLKNKQKYTDFKDLEGLTFRLSKTFLKKYQDREEGRGIGY
jgi:hypothetical protein